VGAAECRTLRTAGAPAMAAHVGVVSFSARGLFLWSPASHVGWVNNDEVDVAPMSAALEPATPQKKNAQPWELRGAPVLFQVFGGHFCRLHHTCASVLRAAQAAEKKQTAGVGRLIVR